MLFFPDWGADPVWAADSLSGMVRLDDLPLRAQTRDEAREWTRRWERLAEQDMAADAFVAGMQLAPAESVSTEEWDAHQRDGREVWQRVRIDLGEEWLLGWPHFSEDSVEVEWSPGGPKERLR
jgi:hypothetical protein